MQVCNQTKGKRIIESEIPRVQTKISTMLLQCSEMHYVINVKQASFCEDIFTKKNAIKVRK